MRIVEPWIKVEKIDGIQIMKKIEKAEPINEKKDKVKKAGKLEEKEEVKTGANLKEEVKEKEKVAKTKQNKKKESVDIKIEKKKVEKTKKEEPVEDFGPYKVPKNGYFVMGDNRNNSNDAREWETHYVSRDEVLGKAWFRYYPSIKVIK